MNRKLATLALSGVLVLTPTIAYAAESDDPYVIALWSIDSNSLDPDLLWGQTLVAHKTLAAVDLGALDDQMECGTAYQVDVYDASEKTDALIAAAVLDYSDGGVGSKEDHVDGGGTGYSWKVFETPACLEPEIPPKPSNEYTYGEWYDVIADCEASTATRGRTVTEITYVWDKESSTWKKDEGTLIDPEVEPRDILDGECPLPAENTDEGDDEPVTILPVDEPTSTPDATNVTPTVTNAAPGPDVSVPSERSLRTNGDELAATGFNPGLALLSLSLILAGFATVLTLRTVRR